MAAVVCVKCPADGHSIAAANGGEQAVVTTTHTQHWQQEHHLLCWFSGVVQRDAPQYIVLAGGIGIGLFAGMHRGAAVHCFAKFWQAALALRTMQAVAKQKILKCISICIVNISTFAV